MRSAIALAILVMLPLIPMAEAHAAPAARSFETRVLHDHNDDSIVVLAGKHGFDTIALDIREGFLANLNESTVIFKLILNGGCSAVPEVPGACGALHEDIEVTAGGTDHVLRFTTEDGGETWTGDFDFISAPQAFVPADGDRFFIEGHMAFSKLGIEVGDTLSNFFVKGYHESETADNMPQGAGDPSVPDPLDAAYNIGSYTVQAPDYYLSATRDGMNVTVTNLLGVPQTVSLSVAGGTVEFDGSSGESLVVDLAGGAAVTVNAMAGTSQRFLAVSDLSGVAEVMLDAHVDHGHGTDILSGAIPPGGNYSFTFDVAGLYQIHEHNSGAMQTITVIDGAGGVLHTVDIVDEDTTTFDPAVLTAKVGDTVMWINQGSADRIVMGELSEGGGHNHDDHDHDEHEEKDAPGLGLVLVLALLVGLARRRK